VRKGIPRNGVLGRSILDIPDDTPIAASASGTAEDSTKITRERITKAAKTTGRKIFLKAFTPRVVAKTGEVPAFNLRRCTI